MRKKCVVKIHICLSVSFVFLLSGCVLFSQKDGSVWFDSADMSPFQISMGTVRLEIDRVAENDLRQQSMILISTLLAEGSIPAAVAGQPVVLNADVMQRSFLQGIEQKNSIFILFSLVTPDGRQVGSVTSSVSGNETLFSAVTQQKLYTDIIKKIADEQKNRITQTVL